MYRAGKPSSMVRFGSPPLATAWSSVEDRTGRSGGQSARASAAEFFADAPLPFAEVELLLRSRW